MRKIISCVIGIALLFTSIFPGNLIDYKINTEQQEDKILINEELLYRGKDIEELKAIIPYTYKMLIVNDKDCSIIDSINLNEINEIHIQYEKDTLSIENREGALENYIVEIKQPRENRYLSIFKSVILSPSLLLYSSFVFVDLGFRIRDKFILNSYNYSSNDTKYSLYFVIVATYLVTKVIIHEILKNKVTYAKNNKVSYESENDTTKLLFQYRNGYNEASANMREMKGEGIVYNSEQKKYNLTMNLSDLGLTALFPFIGYYLKGILHIQVDDPNSEWLLFLVTPIFISVLDAVFLSVNSVSHIIQMKNNKNLQVLQAYKLLNEKEDVGRAYRYGFHQAIQDSK